MSNDSFILVTLDSCTYLSYLLAKTPFFDSIGHAICGRSHGCETLSAHRALLSGHFHHCSEMPGRKIMFEPIIAEFFAKRGYATLAAVSMVLLSPKFGFNRGFEQYKWTQDTVTPCNYIVNLRENLNWLSTWMKELPGPYFIFLNVGETHYPYWNEDDGEVPYWSEWEKWTPDKMVADADWYKAMGEMAREQIRQVEWVDGILGEWADTMPHPFKWYVTADHGEMWGEEALYNHGHGGFAPELYVPVVCSDWDWFRSNELKGA